MKKSMINFACSGAKTAKRAGLSAGLALLALTATAQNFHLGGSIGAGTTGLTLDLAATITDYVGLRAGADVMPKFKYSTDISLKGVASHQQQYDQLRTTMPGLGLPATTFPQKVDIEGKLNNTTGHVLLDLYPGRKVDWHLTVGAYFGPAKVVSVYTTDDSQLMGVRTFNDYVAANPALGYGKIGLELGDFFLEPDARGHVDAYIKTASFRPYVGLGWGRAVPKNHALGFSVDLGAQLWGTPKVYCQDQQLTEEDLDGNDGGVMKVLTKITVYPTLTFRLTGKFF